MGETRQQGGAGRPIEPLLSLCARIGTTKPGSQNLVTYVTKNWSFDQRFLGASRSEAVMVAAGFNPRMTIAQGLASRSDPWGLKRSSAFNRRFATAGGSLPANRGLKPTATFISP